jgi:TonB-linked SusC/RagA family outer membrane protein
LKINVFICTFNLTTIDCGRFNPQFQNHQTINYQPNLILINLDVMKKSLPQKRVIPWAKGILLLLVLTLLETSAFAQGRTITGTVTDQLTKETLPGASVIIKGTTNGASTDINGKYSLNVTPNDKVLLVSFIGYTSAEVAIGAQNVIDVQLSLAQTTLDEVVVVGYGTSKVKDLTSSITTIKSADLLKTPASQPMNALQGKVAGLQVVATGQPGSSPTIRVRGVGSFPGHENEAPLYVVDGAFYDNIDFLNPADIASISVLKDASASAIYGTRAANGVILIETKSGTYNQKTEITYDGYVGYQMAQNVVKMANSAQFAQMALESGSASDISFVNNAMQRYGRSRVNPNVPDVNTDWYKEVLRSAKTQNHSLSFDGGNEKAKFSIGTNYFFQEGILKSKNDYERINIRTKVDFKASKWLTVGGNFFLSNATQNNADGSTWSQAYYAVPILPVYDESNTAAWPTAYASAADLGYRSGQNPFPTMEYNEDQTKIKKLLANIYMEFTLIPKVLTFKTTYNNNYTSLNQRKINKAYYIGDVFQNKNSTITKASEMYNNQTWDNILTLNEKFNNHNLTLMAGSSYKIEEWQKLSGFGKDLTDQNTQQSWYISQTTGILTNNASDDGFLQYGLSYFGRLSYNYADRYLLYATMRADGSSKYQQKWGYFPAIGAGWVISEEKFLKNNEHVPYLKLRASWGQLGNDKIAASDGERVTSIVTTAMGGTGTTPGTVYSGTVATNSFSALKWEVTEETNVGITARLLKDKLSADFDYYIRDTKNAAIPVILPGVGTSILKPVGTIRNKGLELALEWSDKINEKLSYTVGVNMATLKNEARDLYGQTYIDGGSAEFRQRTYVGEPLMAFYGWKTDGVYQNDAAIQADPAAVAYNLANPSAKLVPGDFKYKDLNGDNVIDDKDRTILGTYFPSFTYGANLSVTYMNFDFSASMYGQTGNKILNRKRGEVIWTNDQNMDADLAINRWHGDGTSDKYPSSSGLRRAWNQKMSDYFVEDGSFFRIQNVQIGYTIKNKQWLGGNFPVCRVAFTADRPLTLFKYNGFTPEVQDGIDSQTYPVPAVYTVGLKVKF